MFSSNANQSRRGPMQPTHNTLSENIRGQSVELLNKHLAAAIDLHAQSSRRIGNVRGSGFIAIHELFDKGLRPSRLLEYDSGTRRRARRRRAETVQIAAENCFSFRIRCASPTATSILRGFERLGAFGQSAREAIVSPRIMATRTRLIYSPKCREALIDNSGSSNRIGRPNECKRCVYGNECEG